jgi:hypothetical protein
MFEEKEVKQLVADAVGKVVTNLVSDIKTEFAQNGVGYKPQSSISFEADQRTVKPKIHMYAGTTEAEIAGMLEVGWKAFMQARNLIEANNFQPAPIVNPLRSNGV